MLSSRPDRACSTPAGILRCALLVVLMAALAGPRSSWAWTPQGDVATGALAYDDLMRRDPEAVATAIRLMRLHPDRGRFDHALGDLTGPARHRRTFELMARWPDDARSGPLNRPSWHYAEQVVSPWRAVLPFTFGDAVGAFHRNLRLARDRHAAPADRAVALCWVMHIVGDMHQPLHAGMWMSAQFPLTDRGGTSAWVRAAPGAPPRMLHVTWDSLGVETGDPLQRAGLLIMRLERDHPDPMAPPPADPEVAFAQWVDRSRVLARSVAYQDGALKLGGSPERAVVLPSAYIAKLQAVGQGRLAEAGYRIGALLAGLR